MKCNKMLTADTGASNNTEPVALSLETTLEPAGLDHLQQGQSAFIDEREALRRVPVSRRTWFDWREKKGLPYIRVGKRIVYDWASVRAWLLRQQRGGQQ
jgi:hypothetical protein